MDRMALIDLINLMVLLLAITPEALAQTIAKPELRVTHSGSVSKSGVDRRTRLKLQPGKVDNYQSGSKPTLLTVQKNMATETNFQLRIRQIRAVKNNRPVSGDSAKQPVKGLEATRRLNAVIEKLSVQQARNSLKVNSPKLESAVGINRGYADAIKTILTAVYANSIQSLP